MRPHHLTLGRQQVHRHTARYLQDHLPLRDYRRKTTAGTLWSVLLAAAARISSVHDTCSRLRAIPSEETLRKALIASLPGFVALQRQLNHALAGRLPKALRRRRLRLAIDLTAIPYHGRPFRDPSEIYRGQAKGGTSHFHAYATAYVVDRGRRYTVALAAVTRREPLKDVVRGLLRQARSVGVRPRLVLLDRAFYGVEVIRYLQAARCPFLMPIIGRGRKPTDPRGPSGTNVFVAMARSGWHEHTLSNAAKRAATVAVAVVCRNQGRKRGRPGRRAYAYACWGAGAHSCAWVAATYRLRFGIESSYRQMNQARIRTSTRRPGLRLLYAGLALVLRNEWVWLHSEVLSTPRRGGRLVRPERLRLRTLLSWLLGAIEAALGTIDETIIERQRCPQLAC
jgi:putative transposase